jgi:hypothetical protein
VEDRVSQFFTGADADGQLRNGRRKCMVPLQTGVPWLLH